jgi:hypothetical protein
MGERQQQLAIALAKQDVARALLDAAGRAAAVRRQAVRWQSQSGRVL